MRTQKANDNGTPIVGTETSLSKVLPLYDIFEYDEATHTLTLGTNLYVDGEIYPFVMAKYYRNQGDWSATGSYEVNDIVDYEHIKYVCIENVSANDESPATDTDHWEVFTELKTINGNSLFGDGDLTITTSGTLSIDTELDTTSTNAVQNKVIAVEVEKKANTDGYYEEMTVGSANQLLLNRYINNLEPYNYRTSGGSADIGDRVRLNKLVGGSVVLNQLIRNPNFEDTNYWYGSGATSTTITVSNNVGSIAIGSNVSTSGIRMQYVNSFIKGHTYLCKAEVNVPRTARMRFTISGGGAGVSKFFNITADTWTTMMGMLIPDNDYAYLYVLNEYGSTVWEEGDILQFKNVYCFDLTQMFGSAVADRLYALEQASAGAGVKAFRDWFAEDYYAYNTGTMLSTKASKKNNVGFNQWDEEWEVGGISNSTGNNIADNSRIRSKNFVRVIPNTTYYLKSPTEAGAGIVYWYDNEQNFISYATFSPNATFTTPSNAMYLRFICTTAYGTTYNNDICINLSWSGTRNGEYEPYEVNSYDLPNVVLRGLYKVDGDGNFYFDGDYITPDGTLTRRFGIYKFTGNETVYYDSANSRFYFDLASGYSIENRTRCISNKYIHGDSANEGYFGTNVNGTTLYFHAPSGVSTVDGFKTWALANNLTIQYPLATPTTETSTSYQQLEIVNDWGTEEFVCVGYDEDNEQATTIAVPMGHDSDYYTNASDKLANAPDLPSDTGDYIMHYNASTRSAEYELLGTYLNNNGYVKPTEITGYDATATQILKNVNGTLTWVNE